MVRAGARSAALVWQHYGCDVGRLRVVESVAPGLGRGVLRDAHQRHYDRDVSDWTGGGESSGELIGVADIDDGWALIAEINGYVGVTERLIEPMSVGRTVVSHFRNVNAAYRFHWWRDGTLLVDVDLLFPAARFGADPDALAEDIRDVGIPLDRPDDIAAVV
ncbi:Uncharacterised protein [Mycolicibacterium phlei]|nr:Uncharacterised protein [Mycolicibacterium phlei]